MKINKINLLIYSLAIIASVSIAYFLNVSSIGVFICIVIGESFFDVVDDPDYEKQIKNLEKQIKKQKDLCNDKDLIIQEQQTQLNKLLDEK